MILAQKTYQIIKDRIVTGVYTPGQPLHEKEIIAELQVSRTPFREAIRALSEEHLVQIYPNRGVFVRELSLRDVSDGFDIRYLLEPYCVQIASTRMSIALIEELLRRNTTIDRSDYRKMLEEDDFLHQSILDAVDNKQLVRMMKNLYEYNHFQVFLLKDFEAGYVTEERKQAAITSLHEHYEILTCMLAGNNEEIEKKVKEHILNARHRALK